MSSAATQMKLERLRRELAESQGRQATAEVTAAQHEDARRKLDPRPAALEASQQSPVIANAASFPALAPPQPAQPQTLLTTQNILIGAGVLAVAVGVPLLALAFKPKKAPKKPRTP